MSEHRLEVYKSIAAVQGALAKEGISKDRTNQQQGFKYRGIDDVYAALSPLLAENNLCILPRIISKDVVERQNSKGTALFYTTVDAEFDLVSAVDGSRHTVRSYGEAMDSGDKSIGKAMSYAYKAMAFMTFAIPTEGDNDPDANSHEVQPKYNKPTQNAPKSVNHTEQDLEYIEDIKGFLKAVYGDDKTAALNKVEELTSFIPKGKTDRVKGVRDFTSLTGKRLEILRNNLRNNLQKQLPSQDEICAVCCAPLHNGVCINVGNCSQAVPF